MAAQGEEATKGLLTRPPALVRFVEAKYPESERAAGKGAAVVLSLVVDDKGHVEEVTVTQSAGAAFDAAAVEAARAFQFSPAEIDHVPARIRLAYRYQFTLKVELPTTATFRGVVRERGTRRPLAGIAIEMAGAGRAVTDAKGAFAITDAPPGKHAVTLSGPRLTPTRIEEELTAGQNLDVTYDVGLAAPAASGPDDDLEIVVAAPPLKRNAVSTEVSAAEARKVPGTQGDVLRVVENMPGVARASAGSATLVVWGAAPEDTHVYVDGVPVPRLYHDGGLRSILPTDLVASVELSPGGYGPEYGRGLGGLVTVGTAPLEGKGVHGSVGLDLYDVALSLRSAITDKVHVAVALRRSHLDEVLSLADSSVGSYFPIPHYWDGQARVLYTPTPRESWELTGLFSTDQTSLGVASLDPALVASQTSGLTFYRVYGRYRRQLDDGSAVTVTPFAGSDQRSLTIRVGGASAGATEQAIVAGLRAAWRGRLAPSLTLSAGLDADVRSSALTRNGSIALPPREGDVRVFGQAVPDTLTFDQWNVVELGAAPYAEADISLLAGTLHVVPGLRVDPYARTVSRRAPAVGDTPDIGLLLHDFSVEPRLTLRWAPSSRVSLQAAAGRYHQYPAPSDLGAVFGNPALPVSAITETLLGTRIEATRALAVEVTAFYSASSELAVRSSSPSPALAEALVATGEGRAYGAQILVRQQLFHNLFGWASYTLSRSERRTDASAPWRLFDYDQTHLFTAVASYNLPLGFEAGLRVRLASGYPRTPVDGAWLDSQTDVYQPIFGAQNSIRIPFFFQLDARLARHFHLGASDLEVSLDIQNLTNRSNAEELVYNHDYTKSGTITGLPTLVVAGARWTF